MKIKKNFQGFPFKIALLYLMIGFIWIACSDRIIEFTFVNPKTIFHVQTYKGFFYVITTAVLLYILVRKKNQEQQKIKVRLNKKISDFEQLNEKFLQQNKDLKVAHEHAQYNERFLELIIENIPDFIYVKDIPTGNFVLLNKAVEKFLDLKRSDLIDKNDYSVFPPEIARKFIEKDADIVHAGKALQFEEQLESKAGIRTLSTIKIPVLDSNGEFRYLLGISKDITEEHESKQELINAKNKAEESDRLKTAFLQNLSHEIRTPMNAIYGFSALLVSEEITQEQKINYTTIIQSNTERLLNLITDVLTIASIETNQLTVNKDFFILSELIQEINDHFIASATNKGLKFTFESSIDRSLEIKTDRTKLKQIISNLVCNAIKFSFTGAVKMSFRMDGNYLHCSVIDTGIGIEKLDQEHLFTHFGKEKNTFTENKGSLRFGLTICKAFVEMLDGKILLNSKVGSGSTFSFFAPVECLEKKHSVKSTEDQKKHLELPITILVAEDEDMNYLLIEVLLQKTSWRLIRAKNGQEAVDLFLENPTIQLVLMDIRMPIKNGHEAAKELKILNPELPIIAQTAFALDSEVEKYRSLFDSYLTKPLKAQILIQTIKKYVED